MFAASAFRMQAEIKTELIGAVVHFNLVQIVPEHGRIRGSIEIIDLSINRLSTTLIDRTIASQHTLFAERVACELRELCWAVNLCPSKIL